MDTLLAEDVTVLALGVPQRRAGGGEIIWTPCAVGVFCGLDAKTGAILSRAPIDGLLTGVPTIFGTSIYVALNDPGGLVKFNSVFTISK